MSDQPFTIPVIITDPDFQGLFNDMKTSLVSFDTIIEELKNKEWSLDLLDEVLDKLEEVRLASKTAGDGVIEGLVTIDTTIQAASALNIAQGAAILSELQSQGLSNDEIKVVLDAALEELKKIKFGTGLTTGTNLDKGAE